MHYHRQNDNSATNMIGIAVLAAAVGAIAGLLFAPKSGEETRAEIRTRVNDMKEKSGDKAESARQKVHEGVDKARSKVHDMTGEVRNKTEEATDKADAATDRAATRAKAQADETTRRARGASE